MLEKYVYGNGLIASSETRESQSPKYRTYLYDLRGSVTFTLDSSANITSEYQYSTYGTRGVVKGNTTSELGYCAREGVLTEVTGLLYMRARYYMPDFMRFINQDIVTGDISNSNSLNRDTYVEGNPATMIDPFGLCAERTINAVEGSYNVVKGGTIMAVSEFGFAMGTILVAAGGPLGWLLGGVLLYASTKGFACGVSDMSEGCQQITQAMLNTSGTATNFVRDIVLEYDEVTYTSYEMGLVFLMQGAASWGESYVNSSGRKVSVSQTTSHDNPETEGGSESVYIPRDSEGNPIPLNKQRINGQDIPLPDPAAEGRPHTVLGGKVSSETGEVYRQSATFPGGTWPSANGYDVPWSEVHWTDHGTSQFHTNPHEHIFEYNPDKGGWIRKGPSDY